MNLTKELQRGYYVLLGEPLCQSAYLSAARWDTEGLLCFECVIIGELGLLW